MQRMLLSQALTNVAASFGVDPSPHVWVPTNPSRPSDSAVRWRTPMAKMACGALFPLRGPPSSAPAGPALGAWAGEPAVEVVMLGVGLIEPPTHQHLHSHPRRAQGGDLVHQGPPARARAAPQVRSTAHPDGGPAGAAQARPRRARLRHQRAPQARRERLVTTFKVSPYEKN
jgi:hypothetical protein